LGNRTGEGHGETRPRTGPALEDRPTIRGATKRRRERSPDGPRRHDRQEECLDRPRDPLPTRVQGLPDLPPEFGAALDEGLAGIGLELAPPARTGIYDHVRLLLAWNRSINLTAIREPVEIARRHIVDSLSAVPELRRLGIRSFVDIGSGGGFPGLPLAAALPADRALLVESIGKKASFLEAASMAVGLADRVAVAPGRAEDLAADPDHRERWPAVVARAVGPLADLVELAFPLLAPGGSLVAWKGDLAEDELAAGQRAVEGLGGGRLAIVVAAQPEGHRLVVATKRGRTAATYPRSPTARRNRPW
jgi:16S rRNA (guanine527-N7)-methyltransferase